MECKQVFLSVIYLQDQKLPSIQEDNLLSFYTTVWQEVGVRYIWCLSETVLVCFHSNNKCFCTDILPHNKPVLDTTVEINVVSCDV